jgi:hypothetical protein
VECGTPQVSAVKPQTTAEELQLAEEAEYIGAAFILPGAEVWFGQSYADARQISTTRKVNLVVVDKQRTGQTTLKPNPGVRLEYQDFGPHGKELACGPWLTEYGVLVQGKFYSEKDGSIYLPKAHIIPVPQLNSRFAVLLPTSGDALEVAASALTSQGWARTSTATGSLQLQKSSVNAFAAAFLFLSGIVPGLLYLLVQQGRPSLLDVRMEHLNGTYSIILFTSNSLGALQLESLVERIQRVFEPNL